MSENLRNLETIEKLLGHFKKEELKNTDSFISDRIAIFIPILDFCEYAVKSMHSHPSYHFILAFNDQIEIKIGSKNVLTEPKKLLIIPPNMHHKEIIKNNFLRYIAIFIDKDFFEEQLHQYSMKEFNDYDFVKIPSDFFTIIKEFMIEVNNKIPGWESLTYANDLRICHYIIRSIMKLKIHKEKIKHRLEVDETIEYMHSNMGKKITINELAGIAHMSPSYYNKTFKKEMGQSSINYLNQIRLERVKRLLLQEDKSITEIALECGFNSLSYLSASFYNKFKISPTDYRKLFKKDYISKV